MEVEVCHAKTGKMIMMLTDLSDETTVYDMKKQIYRSRKNLTPERQALKLDIKGKFLSDDLHLSAIDFKDNRQLFLKDLGPQIGWKTVFMFEYAGPLVLYMVTYLRPAILYGAGAADEEMHYVVNIAAGCWTVHYSKRLLETLFVHRFSHATMPLRNLFKNCTYYWLFGMYIGYYVNHPLYTPPTFGDMQIYGALGTFAVAELGNLSIHVALRNLRPPGTRERKIPRATSNPLTALFSFVSCPNYTYEVISWTAFTVMTQCVPAGLFTIAGLYQMAVWAIGKHKNYKKDFPDYPKSRKAIIPFIL